MTVNRADAAELSVTALDLNGYATDRKAPVAVGGGSLSITLLPDVLYYVVERQ